jgi:hypothetical protein
MKVAPEMNERSGTHAVLSHDEKINEKAAEISAACSFPDPLRFFMQRRW